MSEPRTPVSHTIRFVGYAALVLLVALATLAVILLLENIATRKREATEYYFKIVEIDDNTVDPSVWGRNFPRQFDGYRRTVDTTRTKHGGSDAFGRLEADPRWVALFSGYPFAVDYREDRGHAYMLADQDETRRVREFQQPGACLHCHSSVIPAYRQKGREAGIGDDRPRDQLLKGFELVCAMPYAEARKLVEHPVACIDCHEPDTMRLRVTRPGFLIAIQNLAKSDYPLPQYPSIERWRRESSKPDYSVNAEASRQEMRTFVCAQCHVEYYFKGEGKLLTYPWDNGLRVEQIERYYDEANLKDWSHAVAGSALLKAQHPEFETFNQGIHARSGVACADCHMPYLREGAIKVSDHHVRSPLLDVNRACQTCHRHDDRELLARALAIQDRTAELVSLTEDAVLALIDAIAAATEAGASDDTLRTARDFHRKAFWRLDFASAENSTGFHAPQETACILAEALDFARKGQVEALTLRIPATQPEACRPKQP